MRNIHPVFELLWYHLLFMCIYKDKNFITSNELSKSASQIWHGYQNTIRTCHVMQPVWGQCIHNSMKKTTHPQWVSVGSPWILDMQSPFKAVMYLVGHLKTKSIYFWKKKKSGNILFYWVKGFSSFLYPILWFLHAQRPDKTRFAVTAVAHLTCEGLQTWTMFYPYMEQFGMITNQNHPRYFTRHASVCIPQDNSP